VDVSDPLNVPDGDPSLPHESPFGPEEQADIATLLQLFMEAKQNKPVDDEQTAVPQRQAPSLD
jgi:hypothetical protein